MTARLAWRRRAEQPALQLWLHGDDGQALDLTGHTLRFRIGHVGRPAVLDKTAGITAAVQSGSEPDGTPAVTVVWAPGELDVTPGVYAWELIATDAGGDRYFAGQIAILDVIADP